MRREDVADHAAVREVVSTAFTDSPMVADLVSVLRADHATDEGLSFVAEVAGAVVGHVLLSRAWVDAAARLVPVLVLSPLSVDPAWHGQGIGGVLVRHALAAAEEVQAPLVFLEGSPLYYTPFGFRRASRLGFEAPSVRIPDAAFLVATLPAWQEWMVGRLVYADAFWRLDAVGLRDGAADVTDRPPIEPAPDLDQG